MKRRDQLRIPSLTIYISGVSLLKYRDTLVARYDNTRYNGTRHYRSAHSQCVVIGEIHEPALFCQYIGILFSCARRRWAHSWLGVQLFPTQM